MELNKIKHGNMKCPFCDKLLDVKLIAKFYYCKDCAIAIREEEDMPVHFYDESWVKDSVASRLDIKRALYALKQIKSIPNVKTILDIGCGIGVLVDLLNNYNYNAEGTDSSSAAIEYAKNMKKGNFYLCSEKGINTNKEYDLIIATQLIEHLRDPKIFFACVKRILKPNGYLYIETPNLRSWNIKSPWRKRIGGMYYGRDHRIVYTIKSLSNLLVSNNFMVHRAFTKTFSPTIIKELAQSFLDKFKIRNCEKKSFNVTFIRDKNYNRNILKNICKNTYDFMVASYVFDILSSLPNKMSEIGNRGNQLIIIARNER